MWKKLEELPAHNRAVGVPEVHDPFEAANLITARVEQITLEGEFVVLASCCESVRVTRGDVFGWREVQGRDGALLHEVRLRRGAVGLVQRVTRLEPDRDTSCLRCGRDWYGLPTPGVGYRHVAEGRERRDGCEHCGHHQHGHHGHHGHHGPQEHGPHDHGDHGPRAEGERRWEGRRAPWEERGGDDRGDPRGPR
jgi:hypothetical protein